MQVLFGFLLSLPFTVRFVKLSHGQRTLYVVTVLLSALAIALLVSPVALHRLVFRRHQKVGLLQSANVMAILGLAVVGLAVCGAVLLVVSFVERGALVPELAVLVGIVFAGRWFLVPLTSRLYPPADEDDEADPAGTPLSHR